MVATADKSHDAAPGLPENQAKVLDLIVDVFREHAAWPSWEFVDKIVDRDGVDLETTLREMPFGLVYPDPRAPGWFHQPGQKLAVTLEGLLQSREAGRELRYFVDALRYIAGRETKSVPSQPSGVTDLVVTSDEVREAIGGTDADLKKLLLLIRGERFIANVLNDDGTKWSLRPAREVRTFVGLHDPGRYPGLKKRLLSRDVAPAKLAEPEKAPDPMERRSTSTAKRTTLVAILFILGVAWLYVVVTDRAIWLAVLTALAIGGVFLVAALFVFPDTSSGARKLNGNLFAAAVGVPSLLLTLMSLDYSAKADITSDIPAQVLRAGLLRPEDLPDGWDYIPEGDISGPRGIAAEQYCGETVGVAPAVEVYAALAEAPQLGLRESVFSTVAAFPRNRADDFMREIAGSTRCGEWEPGSDDLTYAVESFPDLAQKVGNDALWLELSNAGGGPQTAVHVYVRIGDVVGHVAYNVPEGGEPSLDPLDVVGRQVERIEDLQGLSWIE